jgi:SAM-dependent methyltransferase
MHLIKMLVPKSVKQSIKSYQHNREKTRLFGDLAPLVPPVDQMFDGPQSLEAFKSNGEEFLRYYKELWGLRRDETMLDVGCGIGRKTLPLTRYFTDGATYEGVDITKAGIDWCRDRITTRYPNFHFQQIDVYNKHYNPTGRSQPSAYKFPFESEQFTFVMLGSVFTHMLRRGLENYLSEIARVMKKGAKCAITYLLLNEESLQLIEAGKSTLDLKYVVDQCRVVSSDIPEMAIAFEESWIKALYAETGLRIVRLDYGSWCGRANCLSYQDMIFAVKV